MKTLSEMSSYGNVCKIFKVVVKDFDIATGKEIKVEPSSKTEYMYGSYELAASAIENYKALDMLRIHTRSEYEIVECYVLF